MSVSWSSFVWSSLLENSHGAIFLSTLMLVKKVFSFVITSFLAPPGLTGLGNLDHGQKKKVLTSETTLLKYTYDMENLRRQSLRIKDRIPRHWSINH